MTSLGAPYTPFLRPTVFARPVQSGLYPVGAWPLIAILLPAMPPSCAQQVSHGKEPNRGTGAVWTDSQSHPSQKALLNPFTAAWLLNVSLWQLSKEHPFLVDGMAKITRLSLLLSDPLTSRSMVLLCMQCITEYKCGEVT